MRQQRSSRQYTGVAARGILMGAADAVPGVSGGTIAFMTGIYEELIFSLKQCGSAPKILFKDGIAAAWQHMNAWFLLALFSGIIISILTVSRVVLYLLAHYPVLLWSFFFGLIIVSLLSSV